MHIDEQTVVTVQRRQGAASSVLVIIRRTSGFPTEAEVAPGEELIVRLELGEEVTVAEATADRAKRAVRK